MLTLNHFKSYLYCKQLKWQLKRSQNTSIPIPQTAFWNSQGKGKGGGQGGGGGGGGMFLHVDLEIKRQLGGTYD